MTDQKLVELFWSRSEDAVEKAETTFSAYCKTIARNILGSPEDVEECLNDTWLRLWNSIPPQRPTKLRIFVGKITRNLAFDRVKATKAEKRGSGELALILDELDECIASSDSTEGAVIAEELQKSVNTFVATLPKKERNVFLRRYFFAETEAEIAKRYALSPNHVSVLLHRSRQKLKAYLIKEGYFP